MKPAKILAPALLSLQALVSRVLRKDCFDPGRRCRVPLLGLVRRVYEAYDEAVGLTDLRHGPLSTEAEHNHSIWRVNTCRRVPM